MRIRAHDVAEYVAEIHGLSFSVLISQRRTRDIARPRQIAMHTMRRLCPHMSYPAIGAMLGGRDHTTVLHGDRQIKALARLDPEIAFSVSRVLGHFASATAPDEGSEEIVALGAAMAFRGLCAAYGQAMGMDA